MKSILMGVVAVALIGIVIYVYSQSRITTATTSPDLDMLKALPYTQWSERKTDPSLKGVTKYDRHRAFPGVNLYAINKFRIFLVDMEGKTLHIWSTPKGFYCEHAEPLDNGEILAIQTNKAIMKLDWNSNVIWRKEIPAHHDIEVLPDGSFLTLVKDTPVPYQSYKVMFDSLVRVSSSGDILDRWSVFKNLDRIHPLHLPHFLDQPLDSETAKTWEQKIRFDYYHMNTIILLPKTKLGSDPRFRAGNLLVCFRNVNLIAILNPSSKEVVWNWGPGELDFPHMPTMLQNGNILIFDNGFKRKYSSVIELDPVQKKIVWQYKTSPPQNFFSAQQGSAQRLPNGNTLICQSAKGYAFEIDRAGKIVWEFWNPEILAGRRRKIYRFIRYESDKFPLNSLSGL